MRHRSYKGFHFPVHRGQVTILVTQVDRQYCRSGNNAVGRATILWGWETLAGTVPWTRGTLHCFTTALNTGHQPRWYRMGPAGKSAVGSGQYIDDQVHIPVSGGQLTEPALVDWGGSYLIALTRDTGGQSPQPAFPLSAPATLQGANELDIARQASASYAPQGPEFQCPTQQPHQCYVDQRARTQGVGTDQCCTLHWPCI